jgi:hypothetical protein
VTPLAIHRIVALQKQEALFDIPAGDSDTCLMPFATERTEADPPPKIAIKMIVQIEFQCER